MLSELYLPSLFEELMIQLSKSVVFFKRKSISIKMYQISILITLSTLLGEPF